MLQDNSGVKDRLLYICTRGLAKIGLIYLHVCTTSACTCNLSNIYTHNYQSKVSIAGKLTALSSMVVAKVRKLSFCRCCKFASTSSVSAAVFCPPVLRSSYDGIFRLQEAKDSHLQMFWKGLYMKIIPCMTEEGCRVILKFLCHKRNSLSRYYTNTSHLPRFAFVLMFSHECTSS